MKHVKSLLIVGSGTAALIAGLVIKRKLNIKVDIVHSSDIGIIGVGESSTEHWRMFCEYIGISHLEALVECNATYKAGIKFEGWSKKDWIHHVNSGFARKWGQYSAVYARQIFKEENYFAPSLIHNDQLPKYLLNKVDTWPANQFNFDTYKLNDYLTKLSKSFGINFFEDKIQDISLNEQGEIHSLTGEKRNYNYDFYLDCTGFKKVLMNKLECQWVSYEKYLKANAAIVFPTSDTENYPITVRALAMDYGWTFRIPTYGRYGNGYIFDKNHISPDQAKEEVERKYNIPIDVKKTIFFNPGQLKDVWIKNCCAVGLSGSFVEPLEATSISTTIQQALLLVHSLPLYDEKIIKGYNKKFTDLLENIRDFIILHYLTKTDRTEFWKEANSIELPDGLKENLDIWKHRLPIKEDFSHLTSYILFQADNFTLMLDSIDHFDKESIKKEYMSQAEQIHKEVEAQLESLKRDDASTISISHKKFVELTRELYNGY